MFETSRKDDTSGYLQDFNACSELWHSLVYLYVSGSSRFVKGTFHIYSKLIVKYDTSKVYLELNVIRDFDCTLSYKISYIIHVSVTANDNIFAIIVTMLELNDSRVDDIFTILQNWRFPLIICFFNFKIPQNSKL